MTKPQILARLARDELNSWANRQRKDDRSDSHGPTKYPPNDKYKNF